MTALFECGKCGSENTLKEPLADSVRFCACCGAGYRFNSGVRGEMSYPPQITEEGIAALRRQHEELEAKRAEEEKRLGEEYVRDRRRWKRGLLGFAVAANLIFLAMLMVIWHQIRKGNFQFMEIALSIWGIVMIAALVFFSTTWCGKEEYIRDRLGSETEETDETEDFDWLDIDMLKAGRTMVLLFGEAAIAAAIFYGFGVVMRLLAR